MIRIRIFNTNRLIIKGCVSCLGSQYSVELPLSGRQPPLLESLPNGFGPDSALYMEIRIGQTSSFALDIETGVKGGRLKVVTGVKGGRLQLFVREYRYYRYYNTIHEKHIP